MEFTVKLKCDTEAFHGGPTEVVRLLREIANRISADGERAGKKVDCVHVLVDYNGNSVGSYGFDLDKRGK